MTHIQIADKRIGKGNPAYIIAEVSCNHEGNLDEAKAIIQSAADSGADAVKIQTYTADTISRNFKTKPKGTIWEKMDLHALYTKAQTPWEWTFELKEFTEKRGMHFFSSPFDETAVDFLVNEVGVPVLKVASFEVVDTKLLEKMAKTGLPIIMSNGMTDFMEMKEAVDTLRANGCKDLALLHCNSGYPAAFNEANLKTMTVMAEYFNTPVGVSDHTLFADHENYARPMAHVTPIEAIALGGSIVEVHLTTDRDRARASFEKGEGGFDWPFSMNPDEFKKMVDGIRYFEKTGKINYESEDERQVALSTHGDVVFTPTEKEIASRTVRPTLWVVRDIKAGEKLVFAAENKDCGNFDSIRPGGGIPIRFVDIIEGRVAANDVAAGTPLTWESIVL
ncbi:MAG TPA: N-acetylneuraminate synthase family protein [Micavibrio sp.]|nr:N-acetylneuraminate synthase family protein [Micavibrio sp.]